MPCKASQHSYDVCFVARGFQMQAVLCWRYVLMTSVRRWVWPTTPAGPGFRRPSILQGCMTVTPHTRKASAPGGAQFDSFSLSQGPAPQKELHEWGQSSPHSYRWRVPGASRNRLPRQEGPLRGRKIWESDPAYLRRRCWAKRLHFRSLEPQIGPAGEAAENNFNAACGLRQLCWVHGCLFFWTVMSCLWYLKPFSNDFKFRWI